MCPVWSVAPSRSRDAIRWACMGKDLAVGAHAFCCFIFIFCTPLRRVCQASGRATPKSKSTPPISACSNNNRHADICALLPFLHWGRPDVLFPSATGLNRVLRITAECKIESPLVKCYLARLGVVFHCCGSCPDLPFLWGLYFGQGTQVTMAGSSTASVSAECNNATIQMMPALRTR